jgi:hypothetical protein
MVRVSQGKISTDLIKESLKGRNKLPDGIAPAQGLVLENIEF